MERFRDLLIRWLISRTADKIIRDSHTPEALEAADKRWRELAEERAKALRSAANILMATPQGQAMRQWIEDLPPSISLSLDDQMALNDALDHPEKYAHLYPGSYTLADVAAAEMSIRVTTAQITGAPFVPPSPAEVEYAARFLDEFNPCEPGSSETDSRRYDELRGSNEE